MHPKNGESRLVKCYISLHVGILTRHQSDNEVPKPLISEEYGQPSVQSVSSMEEKALVKKIDARLIPMLFLIYLAAFLDRYVVFQLCERGATF